MLKKNHHLTKAKKENPDSLIDFYLPTIVQSQGKVEFKISSNIFASLSQTDEGIEKIIQFGKNCYEAYLHTTWNKSIKYFLPSGLEEILLYLIENNDTTLHKKLKDKGFIDFINESLDSTEKNIIYSPVKVIFINKKVSLNSLNEKNINIFHDWLNSYSKSQQKAYHIFLEQQLSLNHVNSPLLLELNKTFTNSQEEMINSLFISLFNDRTNKNQSEKYIEKIYDFILLNFEQNKNLLDCNYMHMPLAFRFNQKDEKLVAFLSQNLKIEKKLLLLNQVLKNINGHHDFHALDKDELNIYDKLVEKILIDNGTMHSIKKILAQNQYINELPRTHVKLEALFLNDTLSNKTQKVISRQKI